MRLPWRHAASLLAGLVAAGWMSPARADRAVVVGVQRYPNLPAGASQLKGCENDAQAIASALSKRYRFQVTLLLSNQATHRGILDAINQVRREIQPGERFVFYFAGHGSDTPRPCLLPSDALFTDAKSHLFRDELYSAVAALRCASRTVILDSCYSGGMARALDSRPGQALKARYFATAIEPQTGASRSVIPANRQDVVDGKDNSICYYTAAMGNEKSSETGFKGTGPHGIFTYFLLEQFNGKDASWATIHQTVKSRVVEFSVDGQHPIISTAYLPVPVFRAPSAAAPTPASVKPTSAKTLWETYTADYTDPARIAVSIEPNDTSIPVNQPFRLTVRAGQSGYLVLLDKNVDGKVYLLFPASGQVDDAKVDSGTAYDRTVAADQPGTESVKAILFTSREKAQAVIDAFPKDGVTLQGIKRIREVDTKNLPFFTSQIVFQFDKRRTP
jgi:hypothetical protein